jgi:hypothetical protein
MNFYALCADALVAVHFGYVSYVIFGQLAIVIGWPLRWRWIRNPWFRISHVTMIVVVAVEAYYDFECPLTTWEYVLRVEAGQLRPDFRDVPGWDINDMSFIGRNLRGLMFFEDSNVLTYSYYGFAGLVLTTLILAPPRFRRPAAPAAAKTPGWEHSSGEVLLPSAGADQTAFKTGESPMGGHR